MITNLFLITTVVDHGRGWRNGHADHLLGLDPLAVSLTCENSAYRRGYRAGYYADADEADVVLAEFEEVESNN